MNEEKIEKIIRCYVQKGMSLQQMQNLKISNQKEASDILRERGLLRSPGLPDYYLNGKYENKK